MRKCAAVVVVVVFLLVPRVSSAQQQSFPAGSFIIPMDVDYQNSGMLKAYGLLYKLLLAGVPVNWCIAPGKTPYTGTTANPTTAASAVDFTASATDTRTSAVVASHGYRGGPFVVDAAYASAAQLIVNAWTTTYPQVAVHRSTAAFVAPVSRVLINAPNIGINADGNEDIAFGYLNAASVPDSKGQAWPSGKLGDYTAYPDVLTVARVAGPTTSNHRDGALFGKTGVPVYCQLMSMHWSVDRSATPEEAVAEMHEFLKYPTHLFAECQAVNQIEDSVNGHFVSTDNGTGEPIKSVACFQTPDNGMCAASQPSTLTLFNSDLPFAQLDGKFSTTGGSEPAYGWAPGSQYFSNGIVMMRGSTANAFGVQDLWMTGVAGGGCELSAQEGCISSGKVSYLGGHKYSTTMPVLSNPGSQGVRLFLNSLFEAACTTDEGQPIINLLKSGPATTSDGLVTFTIDWNNGSAAPAPGAVLVDTLAPGMTFVSATAGGTFANGAVTWSVGDIDAFDGGDVMLTVQLTSYGTYANKAQLSYKVGNNIRKSDSNQTTTTYQSPPDAGAPDSGGGLCSGVTCPQPLNPCMQALCNPGTGTCVTSGRPDGATCNDSNACTVGTTCTGGTCGGGVIIQCPTSTNPCQTMACNPASGCVASNVADATTCSLGDACTTGMTCQGGSCTGGMAVSCPAPGNPCEQVSCVPASGCTFVGVADGASCDDGDSCTTGTTCTGGVCGGGTTVVCPPVSAPCTVRMCTGSGCSTAFATNGTDPNGDCASVGACQNACNGSGACQRTCQGPGMNCSDDASCSTGHCIAGKCGGSQNGSGGAGGGAGVGGAGGGNGGSAGNGFGGAAGADAAVALDGSADAPGKDAQATVDGGDGGAVSHPGSGYLAGGGCNCSVSDRGSSTAPGALLAIIALLVSARRRRRGAARPPRDSGASISVRTSRRIRKSRTMRAIVKSATLLTVLGVARDAAAQGITGFAADRFEPAGAGSQWMTGESLDFQGHLRPAAALVEDWAVNPIVAHGPDGNSTTALLDEQVFTHLDAALMLWDRVRVDLNLPLALVDSGTGTQLDGQTYVAPQSRLIGDVRLGADARIFRLALDDGHVVGAAGLQLFLPTGTTQAFTGDGGVRIWPRVMAAGTHGRFNWAARLGLQYRPRDKCSCSLAPGSDVNGALAAGWRLSQRLMIGPELFASAPLSGGTLAARSTPPAEVLLGAHYAIDSRWDVSVGISRGLTDGLGAPAFRAVAGIQLVLPMSGGEPPSASPPG